MFEVKINLGKCLNIVHVTLKMSNSKCWKLQQVVGLCLGNIMFYVLGIFNVMSQRATIYDRAHLWSFYSAPRLWYWTTGPSPDIPLSHSDIEPTIPFPILIIPRAWLRREKYYFLSHQFDFGMNPWVRMHPKRVLNSFGHPVWSTALVSACSGIRDGECICRYQSYESIWSLWQIRLNL